MAERADTMHKGMLVSSAIALPHHVAKDRCKDTAVYMSPCNHTFALPRLTVERLPAGAAKAHIACVDISAVWSAATGRGDVRNQTFRNHD